MPLSSRPASSTSTSSDRAACSHLGNSHNMNIPYAACGHSTNWLSNNFDDAHQDFELAFVRGGVALGFSRCIGLSPATADSCDDTDLMTFFATPRLQISAIELISFSFCFAGMHRNSPKSGLNFPFSDPFYLHYPCVFAQSGFPDPFPDPFFLHFPCVFAQTGFRTHFRTHFSALLLGFWPKMASRPISGPIFRPISGPISRPIFEPIVFPFWNPLSNHCFRILEPIVFANVSQ